MGCSNYFFVLIRYIPVHFMYISGNRFVYICPFHHKTIPKHDNNKAVLFLDSVGWYRRPVRLASFLLHFSPGLKTRTHEQYVLQRFSHRHLQLFPAMLFFGPRGCPPNNIAKTLDINLVAWSLYLANVYQQLDVLYGLKINVLFVQHTWRFPFESLIFPYSFLCKCFPVWNFSKATLTSILLKNIPQFILLNTLQHVIRWANHFGRLRFKYTPHRYKRTLL